MAYYLLHTTYLVVFIAVFARQLCVPIPALLFLLSAGALAGTGTLDYRVILLVAVLGCVLADLVWFEAGRWYGKSVLRLLCSLAPDPGHCIRRARTVFDGRGLKVLFIAKFVPGLDGICPPLAGMSEVRALQFVLHDGVGAALWSGVYITVGYVFAKELDRVSRYIQRGADALVLILAPTLLAFVIWKLVVVARYVRVLRSRQITPESLHTRIASGDRVVVFDLMRFEADAESSPGISGAIRLNPLELRRKRRVTIPPDLEVVLCCRSKSTFVSARVAAALKKQGVTNVLVLAGGLESWQLEGLPVGFAFAEPASELERLGILIDPPLRPKHVSPTA